ncbi:MAG: hypothetical protein GF315_03695 [candidate division Zixibacteria bacterium]|nr:hypothetical protein [candidate division Zixibacteria bacterium]
MSAASYRPTHGTDVRWISPWPTDLMIPEGQAFGYRFSLKAVRSGNPTSTLSSVGFLHSAAAEFRTRPTALNGSVEVCADIHSHVLLYNFRA